MNCTTFWNLRVLWIRQCKWVINLVWGNFLQINQVLNSFTSGTWCWYAIFYCLLEQNSHVNYFVKDDAITKRVLVQGCLTTLSLAFWNVSLLYKDCKKTVLCTYFSQMSVIYRYRSPLLCRRLEEMVLFVKYKKQTTVFKQCSLTFADTGGGGVLSSLPMSNCFQFHAVLEEKMVQMICWRTPPPPLGLTLEKLALSLPEAAVQTSNR